MKKVKLNLMAYRYRYFTALVVIASIAVFTLRPSLLASTATDPGKKTKHSGEKIFRGLLFGEEGPISEMFPQIWKDPQVIEQKKSAKRMKQWNDNHQKVSALRVLFEIAAIGALIFHLVTITRAWSSLPAQVPVHFGISGHPDKWESKHELWVLPVLSLIIYLGLTVLARYPHKFNYPWEVTPDNAERQYRLAGSLVRALKAETMFLFAIISWQSIRVAMNQSASLGALIPVAIAVSTFTIVIYLWLALRAA